MSTGSLERLVLFISAGPTKGQTVLSARAFALRVLSLDSLQFVDQGKTDGTAFLTRLCILPVRRFL